MTGKTKKDIKADRKIWFDLQIFAIANNEPYSYCIGSFSVDECKLNGLSNLDILNYVYLNFGDFVKIKDLTEIPNKFNTYYEIDRYFGCHNVPCIKYMVKNKTAGANYFMVVTNIHTI